MKADRLPLTEDELVPPSAEDVRAALLTFSEAVKAHYAQNLVGMYLFGSRARGDNRPNSDADVAVVLRDGDWVLWRERSELVRLAYPATLESGLLIQPWPVTASQWSGERDASPAFVRTASRDAIKLASTPAP